MISQKQWEVLDKFGNLFATIDWRVRNMANQLKEKDKVQ